MAVLLAFSCTKSELTYESRTEIAIRLPQTKDLEPATSVLNTSSSFGLYAFHADEKAGTYWQTAWNGCSAYIDNGMFKCVDDLWTGWKGDEHHPFFYPSSGSLLLMGYSPHISDSEGYIKSVILNRNTAEEANPYLQIEFDQSQDPSLMKDLLYFNVSDSNNGESALNPASPVALVLHYALAQVEFHIRNEYFDRLSATLRQCILSGTFFSGNQPGWLPYNSSYIAGNIQDIEILNLSIGNLVSPTLSVIPQNTDGHYGLMNKQIGGDVVLDLNVVGYIPLIETPEENDYIETTFEITIPIKDHTQRWEMGKKYVYHIDIEPTPLLSEDPQVSVIKHVYNL